MLKFLIFPVLLIASSASSIAIAEPPMPTIECAEATVVSPATASVAEKSADTMLLEEVARRTGQHWDQRNAYPRRTDHKVPGCLIVAASEREMPALLPSTLADVHKKTPDAADAYSLHTFRYMSRPVVLIEGHDARGVLFGIGALLRRMEMQQGQVLVPTDLHLSEQPAQPVRSHQLGYRFKNNTYDAWTLAQFEQQIRDLAVFGANTIQLIAPESDDARTSPLFPATALDTLLGISRILGRYGLNCDIYYPEMEQDYVKPEDEARELARFEALFRQIPRVDAVYIPGGDPGHTPPNLLFPLMEKEAAILRRYHPEAKFYVSAQGLNAAHYEDFYRLMLLHPKWLNGVFFGPQSRDSFEQQRMRIPAEYPMIFYPDIGHAMHAQLPVPDWDPIFALTEGREPINPRPVDEDVIFHHFAGLNEGFVSYSEGVNDDVNKILWTMWGWNPATKAQTILEDYARYFVGPPFVPSLPKAIFDLEKNWRGPLRSNAQINDTLAEFKAIEQNASTPKNNWHLQLALYRAYYDAYLNKRSVSEDAQEAKALKALRNAPVTGATKAIQDAETALVITEDPSSSALRQKVFDLAGDLYRNIGMQLSVKLYGASNWERGANLDRIDIPLNNRVWYTREFARIRALKEDAAKLTAIAQIANWEEPVASALYDDMGDPAKEPDLVRGVGFAVDPELYATAIHGVVDHTSEEGWRWSQLSYAEMLYERPIELNYGKLDPQKHYKLRVTYAGEDYYALPIRLLANAGPVPEQCLKHVPDGATQCNAFPCDQAQGCVELQPPTQRKTNPQTVEYEIPSTAIQAGKLDLQWREPYGQGGSGRGNQVAEVWLIPSN